MERTNNMPSMFHAKLADIDTPEKRSKYTANVVGCEQLGALYACLFADTGFKTICADPNQTAVNLLAKGRTPFLKSALETKLRSHLKSGRMSVTTDVKTAVSNSDVIAITTPVILDQKHEADYSHLENTCKKVGSSLRRGTLVIVNSVVGLGMIEGPIRENLENTSGLKAGIDFGLAYSPARVSEDQTLESTANHELVAASSDEISLAATSAVLGIVTKKEVRTVSDLRTAELATLFNSVRKEVNSALCNELACFSEKARVDYFEVSKLLDGDESKPAQLPTTADRSIREELYLLLENAENLSAKLRIPMLAREVNDEMVKHEADLVQAALRDCGKTLRRARITLLGLSQTGNAKGPLKAGTRELARMLESKGARINVQDPYLSENDLPEFPFAFKKNLSEALEGADLAIILAAHDQFKSLNIKKTKIIMRTPAAIVDLVGIVEPDKVEKEGLIYRGLGRGVWKK